MPRSSCPLCQREAEVTPLPEPVVDRVRCDTCGEFEIDHIIVHVGTRDYSYIPETPDIKLGDVVYILSGLTRQASDAGNPLTIKEDNILQMLQSVAIPVTPLENMDKALLYISERQQKADDEPQVFYDKDYPLAFAKDGREFRFFLDTLVERRLLHRRGEASTERNNEFFRLTPEGWEKIEKLRSVQVVSSQAFVAMWFDDTLQQAWEEGFEPALVATGFRPLRVDLEEYNGKIDDYIIAQIRKSGLLVADFTGHRGGVYFEAGFAWGLGIPGIWTCKDTAISGAHFDTRNYNHVVWTNPADLKHKLQNRIAATIRGRAILGH